MSEFGSRQLRNRSDSLVTHKLQYMRYNFVLSLILFSQMSRVLLLLTWPPRVSSAERWSVEAASPPSRVLSLQLAMLRSEFITVLQKKIMAVRGGELEGGGGLSAGGRLAGRGGGLQRS